MASKGYPRENARTSEGPSFSLCVPTVCDFLRYPPNEELARRLGAIELGCYKYRLFIPIVFQVGYLCNNAHIQNGSLFGQPTEGALIAVAQKVESY